MKTFYIIHNFFKSHIVLILLISLQVNFLYGQTISKDNELRKSLDYMFEHLDKQSVPTGLLKDYAEEEENLDLFTGKLPLKDDNKVTIMRYGGLLKTISSSALLTNPIQSFKSLIYSRNNVKEDGLVYISAMLFQYASIKSNALKDGLIRYENGQIFNSTSTNSPYKLNYVFAGCCLNSIIDKSNITFILPSNFLIKNLDIKSLELDYGSGFQNILYEKKIKAILKSGNNDIKLKVTLATGEILNAHSSIKVEKSLEKQTRAFTYNSLPNESIIITGDSYDGIATKADVDVLYASGHKSIKKPIIFVEGFDPRLVSPYTKGFWNLNRLCQYPKIQQLLKNGYDIIYVDWENSENYIQANSYTLIKVIEWVNSKKKLSGSNEKNIIMGHSLGGIIARYALKTMENKEIKHETSTYISYDAPHLGAYIPLSVLYGFNGIMTFLKEKGIINYLLSEFTEAGNYIKLGEALAYSTSAQQMLAYYVDPAGNFNNQEHLLWQKELNSLGFPKGDADNSNFKMLAIANGSYEQQNIPDKYLSCDFTAGSDVLSFFPLASLAVGISLNDIVACLLSALPGRTSVTGDFELFPASSVGQRITHINVKYKKTFLWTIPISKTVFSYDRDYPDGYLFDTFPSSSYSLGGDKDGIHKSPSDTLLCFYYYKGDINACHNIPFIPTSSALAFGDGHSSSSNCFFTKPINNESPFGQNYYVHSSQRSHSDLTSEALDWISQRLQESIVGSSVGYEGAQYSLSKTNSTITWCTSDSNIATIDQQGVLSIHGRGIISIIAKCDEDIYTKSVIIGIPRYILAASHEPGGYKIDASCIDTQYLTQLSNFNGVIKYNWGIKFPNKEIQWTETDKPDLLIQIDEDSKMVLVFLKIKDILGNESLLQSIEVNSQDIYAASNQNMFIDSQGCLYKENKSKYLYKSARLYLKYRENVADNYKGRQWMATSAMVLSPYASSRKITARDGGPLIKDILPESELEYIKNGSDEGQIYRYMLILLNSDGKSVQFVPVSFTYKANIEK